jgi:hypothetical protein
VVFSGRWSGSGCGFVGIPQRAGREGNAAVNREKREIHERDAEPQEKLGHSAAAAFVRDFVAAVICFSRSTSVQS